MKSPLDLTHIDEIVASLGTSREAVIPILQAIQQRYRYLPTGALKRVCQLTDITPADITGVSTFYTHFRHEPVGRHTIHVCQGTACHVKGSELVQNAIAQQLGLAPGQDTDAKGEFTVESVACLGCCTLAPVVQIDQTTFGRVTPRSVSQVIAESRRAPRPRRERIAASNHSHASVLGEIRIGLGSCCQAQGSGRVHEEILSVVNDAGLPASVKSVGCIGMCHQTPLMELVVPGGEPKFYSHVQPEDVRDIVLRHFQPRSLMHESATDCRGGSTASTRTRKKIRCSVMRWMSGNSRCVPSWVPRSTSPPNTVGTSTRWIWTSTCVTRGSQAYGVA